MRLASRKPSTIAAKNGAVVASVAIPVGTMTPARPFAPGKLRKEFSKESVGIDVAASCQREASALLA